MAVADSGRGHPRRSASIGRTVAVLAVLFALVGSPLLQLAPSPDPSAPSPGIHTPTPDRSSPGGLAGWHPVVANAPPMHYRLNTISRSTTSCTSYGAGGAWMGLDTSDGSVWVAAPPSCVDRMTPTTNGSGWTRTATVPTGTDPFGIAYDSPTNDVAVTNTASDNVTVISAATNLSVASVGVGTAPMGIAYDARSGEYYVANYLSNNVTVINATTLSVVANISVGVGPIGIVVDPATDQVFVADSGSAEVSVISDRNYTVVATAPTGIGPVGEALDNTTDQVYVTNNGTMNVSVINASSDRIAAAIAVPGPATNLEGIAFDAATGLAWVGGGWSVAVVINTTLQLVVGYAGTDPSGVLYDPLNGNVCLANTANVTFECLSFAGTVGITGASSIVTFHATGFSAGIRWGVTANSSWYAYPATTQWSSTSNVTIGGFGRQYSGPDYYEYRVDAPVGYAASPASGSLCFGSACTSSGPTRVNVTFTPLSGYYWLNFTEQGLPNGTYWVVQVGSAQQATTSSTDSFYEPNGTHSYTIGQTGPYIPTPSSGTAVVNGSAVAVAIQFAAPPTYAVKFQEAGLAPGTFWEVWLGGAVGSSTGPGLTLNVTNGTYVYVLTASNYVSNDSPGNVTVRGGPIVVNVTFEAAPYSVVFAEFGLPSPVVWSLRLNGLDVSGGVDVVFSEPNGTFPFSVDPVAGYLAHPSQGNVTVAGTNVNVSVQFVVGNASWNVSVVEVGLPPGTTWGATLGTDSETSPSTTIGFVVPSGTYPLAITGVAGYSARAPSRVVVVDQGVTVPVTFVPDQYPLTFHESGLPTGTGWGVVIGSQVESALGPNVTFTEPNGTYGYVLLTVSGYVAPSSGTVTVNGSARVVPIAFTPQTYPIEFIEFGLPAGSNWSVTVANASTGFNETESSTSNSIVFFLPNGTYSVTFTLPPGFTGASSSNLVVVAGRALTGPSVTAKGPATPPGTGPGTSRLPGLAVPWPFLAAGIVAAAAIGAIAGWLLRRRPGRSE